MTPDPRWHARLEWAGFWGALKTTRLDHYSVARLGLERRWEKVWLGGRVERGLTRESDDWVAGAHVTLVWKRTRGPAVSPESGAAQPHAEQQQDEPEQQPDLEVAPQTTDE